MTRPENVRGVLAPHVCVCVCVCVFSARERSFSVIDRRPSRVSRRFSLARVRRRVLNMRDEETSE